MQYIGENQDGFDEVALEEGETPPWESDAAAAAFEEETAKAQAAQTAESTKGGWFANSWLGRQFGLDDASRAQQAERQARDNQESSGIISWFRNSWLGRQFGLDDRNQNNKQQVTNNSPSEALRQVKPTQIATRSESVYTGRKSVSSAQVSKQKRIMPQLKEKKTLRMLVSTKQSAVKQFEEAVKSYTPPYNSQFSSTLTLGGGMEELDQLVGRVTNPTGSLSSVLNQHGTVFNEKADVYTAEIGKLLPNNNGRP